MDKTILVVGRGLVGSCFENDDRFTIVGHNDWKHIKAEHASKLVSSQFSGFIYTAGIAGYAKCNVATMKDVMDANVRLPVEMMHMARLTNIPFVFYSSTSIYKMPVNKSYACREDDDLHPNNRYAASKIAAEYALSTGVILHPVMYDKTFILRMPLLVLKQGKYNFGNRCLTWEFCEDASISVIYKSALMEVINNIFNKQINGGIYNIASETVHVPTFIMKFGEWSGSIVPADSLQVSPSIIVDITKAKEAGIQHEI